MGLFNYDTEMVAENIDRIMLLLDSLPAWMHFHRMEESQCEGSYSCSGIQVYTEVCCKEDDLENKLNKNIIVGKDSGLTEAQADTAAREDHTFINGGMSHVIRITSI